MRTPSSTSTWSGLSGVVMVTCGVGGESFAQRVHRRHQAAWDHGVAGRGLGASLSEQTKRLVVTAADPEFTDDRGGTCGSFMRTDAKGRDGVESTCAARVKGLRATSEIRGSFNANAKNRVRRRRRRWSYCVRSMPAPGAAQSMRRGRGLRGCSLRHRGWRRPRRLQLGARQRRRRVAEASDAEPDQRCPGPAGLPRVGPRDRPRRPATELAPASVAGARTTESRTVRPRPVAVLGYLEYLTAHGGVPADSSGVPPRSVKLTL